MEYKCSGPCGEIKDESEFYYRANGSRRKVCKKCTCAIEHERKVRIRGMSKREQLKKEAESRADMTNILSRTWL